MKWIIILCKSFENSWRYQVQKQLPKIKQWTSKHLTAQESAIFRHWDFCQILVEILSCIKASTQMLLLNTFGDFRVVLTSNCRSFSVILCQQGKKKLKVFRSLKKVSLELSFHDLCLSYKRRESLLQPVVQTSTLNKFNWRLAVLP